MFTNNLTLNVLNFSHAQKRLTVAISTRETADSFRLSTHDCKALAEVFHHSETLYCVFDSSDDNTKQITNATSPAHCLAGERSWSFSFLKKYYTRQLTHYFRGKGFIASNNFVSDTEVWIPDQSAYPGCKGYRSFTLRIQFNGVDYRPELLVAMGDVKSVFEKPLNHADFTEIPDHLFNRVVYQNRIYHNDDLPDTVRRHLDEAYPCVSFGLLRAMNIDRPAPEKGNRYLKYSDVIEQFRTKYLTDKALHKLLIPETAWKTTQPERLDTTLIKQLQFGEGTHTDPMKGMREFGPKELVQNETVFFFIMHADDKPLAVTVNEYLAGKNIDFRGGASGFLHIKYSTEPNRSIVFQDKNNPLPEIQEKLALRHFDPAKRYVAIYLSPHSKWTQNLRLKTIYYHLKELLLNYGVVSQTIEANKLWSSNRATTKEDGLEKAVLRTGFHFSLPNILVAISAKLGATPWCFEKQESEELVIGISAYKSTDLDKKYVGSAFSFTNEGRFQGFNCFTNKQLSELAGSIALAVKDFCNQKQKLERLVIHFYKRLSQRELKPIEQMLARLGLDIPVVVVSVNKGYSDDLIGFDITREHKMPLSGSYLPLAYGQYLLYNNQLQTGTEKINAREGYPFPLKITIQKFAIGSAETESISKTDEEQLLLQVCRFSQLYWKSVSRQWLPVTLRYPEMLAQIAPHFKYGDIPEEGRESLWFL